MDTGLKPALATIFIATALLLGGAGCNPAKGIGEQDFERISEMATVLAHDQILSEFKSYPWKIS